ncbi:helix-turn-helix domain-containing protein [Fictibacillus sp. CENA-BCM004]|uniref:Helix-turn-helix domain-containing protein n=1 Tax=Fictibacillus terranigra TaxID=3058424 RepID=A0ABT8EDN7_9BACL|nr:helix-turn-helix domain-containing protein [Fictibacillus sp. CENA-BCM004]MDN4076058.1 helix-turn-helix domain-containing protein [Fictibacillus sp. CENA-BCM004]
MVRSKAEEKATHRFQMIAPLLDEKLDSQELNKLRTQICERHGVSERTVRRYVSQFRDLGYEGLKQKPYRTIPGNCRTMY